MNEQPDHSVSEQPASEVDSPSLWRRTWPVLAGIFIALSLASGGYWLGASSVGQPMSTEPAVAASQPLASAVSASSGSASAPAASASDGVSFKGAFTPSAALHAIFGESVRRGSASFARWTQVYLPQTEVFQSYLGSGPLLVSPLGQFSFQEAEETRQLLLFQSVPEQQPAGSRPEGAIIGAAVFRPEGDGWQLVRETRAITAAGAWGQAPAGRPVVMGPTKLGIVFEGSYLNQGEQVKYGFLVEQTESGFALASPVFDLGRDNSGRCSSNGEACHGYSAQLRFNGTVAGGAFLLDLVSRGTRPNTEGGLDSLVDVRQFRYQGGRYVEDSSKHVLKVKPLPETAAPATPAPASAATASAVE